MTNSKLAAVPVEQRPSVCHVPRYTSSLADDAVELVQMAGIELDPWQEFVLRESLGERADGKWAAWEVGLACSRQNGKNEILTARQLAGLFLLEERLIVHTAHEFATSTEAFRRLKERIEATPSLRKRLAKRGIKQSHGEEGIELASGQRIRFRTRTKGGSLGFTCDCLICDEAMHLAEAFHGTLLPTLSARPNPQVWYTGSAVDQWQHENGLVMARVRERGREGTDESLAFFEWNGCDAENPEEVDEKVAADEATWQRANPALGIRISSEYVARERETLDARSFAVQRLGVGDWPSTDPEESHVIGPEVWRKLADLESIPEDPVCIAFDAPPNRASASIAAAGWRPDGLPHAELIERRQGVGWLPERVAEIRESHKPREIGCDAGSGAGAYLPVLVQMGLEIREFSAREYAQACGAFYDLVTDERLRYRDDPALTNAVKAAVQRPLGEAWAWSRKSSGTDISPLVAITLALGMLVSGQEGPSPWERRVELGEALL